MAAKRQGNSSDTLISAGTLTKIQIFKLFPIFTCKNNTEKSLSDISSNITVRQIDFRLSST